MSPGVSSSWFESVRNATFRLTSGRYAMANSAFEMYPFFIFKGFKKLIEMLNFRSCFGHTAASLSEECPKKVRRKSEEGGDFRVVFFLTFLFIFILHGVHGILWSALCLALCCGLFFFERGRRGRTERTKPRAFWRCLIMPVSAKRCIEGTERWTDVGVGCVLFF